MTRNIFGWYYPPGITGNEYEIVGPDYEEESESLCPECGADCIEQGYASERWLACMNGHMTDLEMDEPDYERKGK